MSVKEILVPDIGDFADVDVIEVHVEPGQTLSIDEPMITLENDKASMDLPALEAGTIKEVKVSVGDKISEGSLILLLETEGEASTSSTSQSSSAPSPAPSQPAPQSATTATPSQPPSKSPASKDSSFKHIHASPSIRRLAREKGVNLAQVKGTGRKGRITKEDVEAHLNRSHQAAKPATTVVATGIPPIPTMDFSKFGPISVEERGRIKKLTAAAMTRSWLNIPHVTHNDEADITELEAFRKALKSEAEKSGTRVTLLSFAMKAVVGSLKAFPAFNASLGPEGNTLILKQYYHIGIAVDTPEGLVVPVIRDVDKKSVYELSEELANVSKKARDNKLKLADIQGGTFTISSLGGIGGTTFSPIINAPEVAILGMTRSKMQPVWDGSAFQPRLMQPLSLSYDHRVIDGAEAARFCRHLAATLNDIRRLLL